MKPKRHLISFLITTKIPCQPESTGQLEGDLIVQSSTTFKINGDFYSLGEQVAWLLTMKRYTFVHVYPPKSAYEN